MGLLFQSTPASSVPVLHAILGIRPHAFAGGYQAVGFPVIPVPDIFRMDLARTDSVLSPHRRTTGRSRD